MPDSAPSAAAYPYATHLDVRFGPLERIDVPALVAACTDRWYNQTLCRADLAAADLHGVAHPRHLGVGPPAQGGKERACLGRPGRQHVDPAELARPPDARRHGRSPSHLMRS